MAGLISGGVLAFAADAPLSGAINSTAGPGVIATTSQLSLNFVAPATLGSGRVRATGEVIHVGRRQGLSQARLEDANGRLLAHGTTRCVLLDLGVPPDDVEPPEPVLPERDWIPPYQRPVEGEPIPEAVWLARGGLEIVLGIAGGDLPRPPLGVLTGIRIVEAAEGRATTTLPCTAWLCPPAPNVYGGAIALFADVALGNALLTTLPPGTSYATLDLAVYFVRPVQPDGRLLTARAMVVHRGRSFAVASTTIVNEDGKTVATATTSAMTLDRPWSFEAPPEPADEGPD